MNGMQDSMTNSNVQNDHLRCIQVKGTAVERGTQHGQQLAELIHAFVAQRFDALRDYLGERLDPSEITGALDRFLEVGAACMSAAEAFHAEGVAEHLAVARAAKIDAVRLYAAANMTDVRDVVLLSNTGDPEGCSTVLVPPALTRDQRVLAGQTWDLNPTDLEYVVAIHRADADAEAWTVTCAGCPSLMGMNAQGIAFGTNNIKVLGTRPGAGYLSILHRISQASSLAEAARVVETAPRAAAHTYWLADSDQAMEYECSATRFMRREAASVAVIRTNHCLDEEHVHKQGEPPNTSSRARFARLTGRLAGGDKTVEELKRLFADRSDGVDSISRHPEDEQGTATNACILCVPARLELWACKGPGARASWQKLAFDTKR